MTQQNSSPMVFIFTQDYGSREDCSVFHTTPLVIMPSAEHSEEAVIAIINDLAVAGPHRDYQRTNGDGLAHPDRLVSELADRGLIAHWVRPEIYCND